jgi:hypothetical protein
MKPHEPFSEAVREYPNPYYAALREEAAPDSKGAWRSTKC